MSGAGGAGGTGGVRDDPTQDCKDPIDGSTNNFKCVDLAGQRRCLDPCTKQQECRNGRVCLERASATLTAHRTRATSRTGCA